MGVDGYDEGYEYWVWNLLSGAKKAEMEGNGDGAYGARNSRIRGISCAFDRAWEVVWML
ncbi:hypothetical protein Tco_1306277, partial [Tanacetum coccineum]